MKVFHNNQDEVFYNLRWRSIKKWVIWNPRWCKCDNYSKECNQKCVNRCPYPSERYMLSKLCCMIKLIVSKVIVMITLRGTVHRHIRDWNLIRMIMVQGTNLSNMYNHLIIVFMIRMVYCIMNCRFCYIQGDSGQEANDWWGNRTAYKGGGKSTRFNHRAVVTKHEVELESIL